MRTAIETIIDLKGCNQHQVILRFLCNNNPE